MPPRVARLRDRRQEHLSSGAHLPLVEHRLGALTPPNLPRSSCVCVCVRTRMLGVRGNELLQASEALEKQKAKNT